MNKPALWDKLLAQAPKGSALMGGAVIDYLLGIPVNDYDIFYSYKFGNPFVAPANWKLSEADFNNPLFVKEHEDMYMQGVDENGNHPISSVLEYIVDGEHKVQMIGVMYADPLKHLQNFDHSLTLGSYTSKGMFVHKKVFQSMDDYTITYVSKNHSMDAVTKSLNRAEKKIARMFPKYPHPWNLEGFVAKPKLQWHDEFVDVLA